MVIYATINNISALSWQSVLLVEEIGIPGENHRPVVSHWQTGNFFIDIVSWTEIRIYSIQMESSAFKETEENSQMIWIFILNGMGNT
jgi:hypothetical protein